MTKIIIWILVLGAVITGVFLYTKDKQEDVMLQEENVTVQETSEVPQGKKMAFSQFIAQDDGSYKCTVKQYLSDMENTGTVYIDGGRISGEYTTVFEGMNVDTSFIVKDGYSYTWSSGTSIGAKVPVKAEGTMGGSASGTYSWNADQIGDYDCVEWKANDAQFQIPSTVTFTEMKVVPN